MLSEGCQGPFRARDHLNLRAALAKLRPRQVPEGPARNAHDPRRTTETERNRAALQHFRPNPDR
jgi:hypothetical protein